MSVLGEKCRQSPSKEFEKQTKMKIMGYFSHLYFDPQPVIKGIVNKLLDYCVRPGLIITSSIIYHIRDGNESSMPSDCQLSRQGCGNTMPDLSDLVPFHSGQVENFNLLVLGQVQMY